MTNNPFQSQTILKNHAGKIIIALAFVLSLLVLYGKSTTPSNNKAEQCQNFYDPAKLASYAKGNISYLKIQESPKPMPKLSFTEPKGKTVGLEYFKGKYTLLNIWATWCGPCRAEMPSLDNLQAQMADDQFEVAAINIDTREDARVEDFLTATNVKHLNLYKDQSAKIFQDLKKSGHARGIPTSVLIDKNGCEIARLSGALHWDAPEFLDLIAYLKSQPK